MSEETYTSDQEEEEPDLRKKRKKTQKKSNMKCLMAVIEERQRTSLEQSPPTEGALAHTVVKMGSQDDSEVQSIEIHTKNEVIPQTVTEVQYDPGNSVQPPLQRQNTEGGGGIVHEEVQLSQRRGNECNLMNGMSGSQNSNPMEENGYGMSIQQSVSAARDGTSAPPLVPCILMGDQLIPLDHPLLQGFVLSIKQMSRQQQQTQAGSQLGQADQQSVSQPPTQSDQQSVLQVSQPDQLAVL